MMMNTHSFTRIQVSKSSPFCRHPIQLFNYYIFLHIIRFLIQKNNPKNA